MAWRRLFPLIFLFSCVDGFIANWLYPDRLALLYRDFLVLAVYVLFGLTEPVLGWARSLREQVGRGPWVLATALVLVALIQIFNPLSPGPLVGLLGFKVLFLYWPLALLGYTWARSVEHVRRLLAAVVLVSVPVALFGLYQFWQGPDFLISTFGAGFERALVEAHVEGLGEDEAGFVRVIGTFASTGQFAGFLTVTGMLALSLIFTAGRRGGALLWAGCAVLDFLALLATGSRAGLLALGLMAGLVPIISRRTRRVLAVALIAGVGLWGGFHWLGGEVAARFESVRDVQMLRHRTLETTSLMFVKFLDAYPLGRGLGTGSAASRHLLGEESEDWQLVENDLSKLQLEMGIVGVLLFYGFALALALRWLRRWHRPLDEPTLWLVAPLAAFCIVRLGMAVIVGGFDSAPAAVFFWALLGMVARLSSRAAVEREAREAGVAPVLAA